MKMHEINQTNRLKNLARESDGFAIYQMKETMSNAGLMFTSLSEVKRIAHKMRNDVHHVIEHSEGVLFSSKMAAEAYLSQKGFIIQPNHEPDFIILRNNAGMEAIVCLTHDHDVCYIDGCDTRALNHPVSESNYDLVYSGAMPEECQGMKSHDAICEFIYTKFNMDRPTDFYGHSLSVSDIVLLKQNGQINCYYTDSFGFEKLSDFLSRENPLRNAEMSLEDDYGMIDGIINNGKKDDTVRTSVPHVIKSDSVTASKPKRKDSPER